MPNSRDDNGNEQCGVDDETFGLNDDVRYVTTAEYGLLLSVKSGKFHSLNRSATELLDCLRKGNTARNWAVHMAASRQMSVDTVMSDARLFIGQLLKAGLLKRRSGNMRTEQSVGEQATD